jgi:hypothetical protein
MPNSFSSIANALNALRDTLPQGVEISVSKGRILAMTTDFEDAPAYSLGSNPESCTANDLESFLHTFNMQAAV